MTRKDSNKPTPIKSDLDKIADDRHAGPLQIADNWPEKVPVTLAELEAIETWLKPLLDEILGGGNA